MSQKATLAYIGHMYDPLIAPAEDGSPTKNGIVSDWSFNAAGDVLTLQIRPGVTFHNGDELTAEDVKFTFEVFADPISLSTAGGQLRNIVAGVDVSGPLSVDVRLTGPQPTFIELLSWVEGDVAVIPKKYIDGLPGADLAAKTEAFAAAPIGSGPWRFVSRTVGQSIEYEANESYFNEALVPKFKKLTLLNVPESTTRVNMLRSDEADVIDATIEQAVQLQSSGYTPFLVKDVAHAIVAFIKSYDENFITNDPRIREALILAVDREALISSIFPELPGVGPTAQVARGAALTGPGVRGYREDFESYPYDPERARQLLEEAGYFDQPDNILAWSYGVSDLPDAPTLLEGVAAYWEAIGVEVELRPTDAATLTGNAVKEDPPFTDNDVVCWAASYRPSGLNNLRVFATGDVLKASAFPDRVKQMVTEASANSDPAAFDEAMAGIWRTLYDEYWALPLGWVSKTIVANPDVVVGYSAVNRQGDYAAWQTLVPAGSN